MLPFQVNKFGDLVCWSWDIFEKHQCLAFNLVMPSLGKNSKVPLPCELMTSLSPSYAFGGDLKQEFSPIHYSSIAALHITVFWSEKTKI